MQNRLVRALVIAALIVAVGAVLALTGTVLERVRGVVTMVLLAILVAYLVAPAAGILTRRGVPRALAVLLIYVIGLAVIGAGVAWLAPRAVGEASDLAARAPRFAASAQDQLADPASSPLLGRLPANARDAVAQSAGKIEAAGTAIAAGVGAKVLGAAKVGAETLVRTLLVLLLAFFFVTDAERITATLLRVVPVARRDATLDLIADVDRVVGGFVRGQILLAGVTGAAVFIALEILRLPYATLLALLAGLASIVPFVGPIVGAVPALAIAAVTLGVAKTIILLVIFVVIFELQGHVLTPIVIGRTVGVSPLVVFLAILVGAEADGLLGTLLAIPIAGIARVVLDRLAPADPALLARVARRLGGTVRDAEPKPPPALDA